MNLELKKTHIGDWKVLDVKPLDFLAVFHKGSAVIGLQIVEQEHEIKVFHLNSDEDMLIQMLELAAQKERGSV